MISYKVISSITNKLLILSNELNIYEQQRQITAHIYMFSNSN